MWLAGAWTSSLFWASRLGFLHKTVNGVAGITILQPIYGRGGRRRNAICVATWELVQEQLLGLADLVQPLFLYVCRKSAHERCAAARRPGSKRAPPPAKSRQAPQWIPPFSALQSPPPVLVFGPPAYSVHVVGRAFVGLAGQPLPVLSTSWTCCGRQCIRRNRH